MPSFFTKPITRCNKPNFPNKDWSCVNPSIVAIVRTDDDVKLELEENILGWGPQLKSNEDLS